MVTAGTYGELPFVLDVSGKDITLSDAALPYVVEGVTAGKPLFVPAGDDGELVFSGSLANGARFTKTFTFFRRGVWHRADRRGHAPPFYGVCPLFILA